MKNCRNCKYAKWTLTKNGRRMFANFTPCTYEVKITMPVSREHMIHFLKDAVGIREYADIEMHCDTWEQ